MSREQEVIERLRIARARLFATGELGDTGRGIERSMVFRQASDQVRAAEQERNRLLVEVIGEAGAVPVELVERLDLTRRDAASLIRAARTGSTALRTMLFGATVPGR